MPALFCMARVLRGWHTQKIYVYISFSMWAISSSKSCNDDSLSKFGSKWFRCDTIRICFRRKGDRQVETLKLFQVFHVKMQTSLITEIFLGTATQILCQPISHAASAKLLQQAILCTTFILNTAWDYKCLCFYVAQSSTKMTELCWEHKAW